MATAIVLVFCIVATPPVYEPPKTQPKTPQSPAAISLFRPIKGKVIKARLRHPLKALELILIILLNISILVRLVAL